MLEDTINFAMPFFKQYFAGGPNSMRGWAIRSLGPGSVATDFNRIFNNITSDLQLEANIEYRFRVATVLGWKWNSALFIDVGNVWNRKSVKDADPLGVFTASRLWQDVAIAGGVGLFRFDIDYVIIRVDYGLRLKDPGNKDNYEGGWVKGLKFRDLFNTKRYASLQIGIGFPF
jgi:outer membrane protein assembly factor BamA